MSEIQQGRYDAILRRVADLKGPGSKVNDALSELFPVIDVERVPGELLLLGGTRLCVASNTTAGTVGATNRHQIFNPAGSGVLGTVTQILFSSEEGAQAFRIATTVNVLPISVAVQAFRDRRHTTGDRPTIAAFRDQTVALTDGHYIIQVLSNTTFALKDPNDLAILPPGSGFEIGTSENDRQLRTTFMWRERTLEPSEANF